MAREQGATSDDALKFHSIATGAETPISQYVEIWLGDSSISDKTKSEYLNAFKELSAEFEIVEEIDRRKASEFLRNTLSPGRAPDTVQKKLAAYSGYWRWLMLNGYLPDDKRSPWEGLKPKKSEDISQKRRAFTEEEAKAVLEKTKERHGKFPDDFDVSLLLAVSGLRLEEAAKLKVEDCTDKGKVVWLNIKEAKTEAGKRRVPVVDTAVVQVLKDRLEDRNGEDWLFPALKARSYNKRSHTLSQRLGRTLRLVVKDKSVVASHSWRHRARTLLEQGDVNPWISDWLMGHSRPGEGLNRYSKGPSNQQLIDAIKHVVLPE